MHQLLREREAGLKFAEIADALKEHPDFMYAGEPMPKRFRDEWVYDGLGELFNLGVVHSDYLGADSCKTYFYRETFEKRSQRNIEPGSNVVPFPSRVMAS